MSPAKLLIECTSTSINYMFVKNKVTEAKHKSSLIEININKKISSKLENVAKYPKSVK